MADNAFKQNHTKPRQVTPELASILNPDKSHKLSDHFRQRTIFMEITLVIKAEQC